MKNIKQKIETYRIKEKKMISEINFFSKQLQKKLKLTDNDLKIMCYSEIFHEILGEYKIQSVKKAWNNWELMLEVSPIISPIEYCYYDITKIVPGGWIYKIEELGTLILPDEKIQKLILDDLSKKYSDEIKIKILSILPPPKRIICEDNPLIWRLGLCMSLLSIIIIIILKINY